MTALSGCHNVDTARSKQADIAEIRRFLAASGEAVNAGDVDAEVSRFTEDGIYMWPDAPSIQGHEALRKWFRQRFVRVNVRIENETREIVVSGDWAFERGTYVAHIRTKTGDGEETVRGKYINILRRQPDGSWRIARRIRNRDYPPGQQ
jgi:uncharacterized protein (TIGR02246 family)